MTRPVLNFSDSLEEEVTSYCLETGISSVTTLSDSKTYAVLGNSVNTALQRAGVGTTSIILSGWGLAADEQAITSVLVDIDVTSQALITVGSGTITDIGRFISHRLGKRFISVPTAPSVDGYASSGAPIVLKGYKRTVRCRAPEAIFASLPTLAAAPEKMISAGFGEAVGKVIAMADWRLAHLLIDAPYDEEIAEMARRAYETTVASARGIARREPDSIKILFEALNSTEETILRFGSPKLTSGSEHLISHFIEMRRLLSGGPPILQGAKVAIGTLIAAGWYKSILSWDKGEIRERRLEVPEFEHDMVAVQEILGRTGELVLESNSFLSTLSHHTVVGIRARLLHHWEEIQEIARRIPEPEELRQLFGLVGAPVTPEDLNLTSAEISEAIRYSHYVRSRFTVRTLLFILGITPPEYQTVDED